MSDAQEAIGNINEAFLDITSNPESTSLAVLLLHDVTGVKKKDIKLILDNGCKLSEIYHQEQNFEVHKKLKVKLGT